MKSTNSTSETELQRNNKFLRDGVESIGELLKLPLLNLNSEKDIQVGIESIKNKIRELTETNNTASSQPKHPGLKSSEIESIHDLSVSDLKIDQLSVNDPPKTPTKKLNFSKSYSPMKSELKATKPKPKKLFYPSISLADDKPTYAYEESIRTKNRRNHIPGGECACCKDFNEAIDKGTMQENFLKDRLNQVSRHRKVQARPVTPENYWNLNLD